MCKEKHVKKTHMSRKKSYDSGPYPVRYTGGSSMPMSNDPSSTLHSVDNLSSDDLAPPIVSLRVRTMLREKREGPEAVPQLSVQKMWT